jgi:hypothetical protein
MVNSNLKPIRSTKRAKELGRKGGLSKAPSKVFASRINGLASMDLTEDQKFFASLVRERKFLDLMIELLVLNLQDAGDPQRRDKIIEQITKLLPVKSLNVNVVSEEKIDWKETIDNLMIMGDDGDPPKEKTKEK